MPASIHTLEIPTTDLRFAVRIYEKLFDTRLTEQDAHDPQHNAPVAYVVPHCTVAKMHFIDSAGNSVTLHARANPYADSDA